MLYIILFIHTIILILIKSVCYTNRSSHQATLRTSRPAVRRYSIHADLHVYGDLRQPPLDGAIHAARRGQVHCHREDRGTN